MTDINENENAPVELEEPVVEVAEPNISLDGNVFEDCSHVRHADGSSSVGLLIARLRELHLEPDAKVAARAARREAKQWHGAGRVHIARCFEQLAEHRDPSPEPEPEPEPELEVERVDVPREIAPTEHVEEIHVEHVEPKPVVFPFELALAAARGELGTHEVPGPESNARILDYIRSTHGGVGDDSVILWCSCFIEWCLQQTGRTGTGSRWARSWLSWGVPSAPREGAICVLWREDPHGSKGHVGFYVGETENSVLLLGGNQMNQVCIRKYPKARVLGYRWAEG